MSIETKHVRLHFDRAAEDYLHFAYVQEKILTRLLEMIQPSVHPNAKVLDVGSGPGALAVQMLKQNINWQLTQLDLSFGMCLHAHKLNPSAVQANALALPFADNSFDMVFSSLTLQWVNDQQTAFNEIFRVLKPGGVMAVASFGTATLQELKHSFAAAGSLRRVSAFTGAEELQQAVSDVGFANVDVKQNIYTDFYEDVWSIMHALKAIGATNSLSNRSRGLAARAEFENMEAHYVNRYATDDGLPVSWDVIMLTGKKPA